jgi:hypothetical protein
MLTSIGHGGRKFVTNLVVVAWRGKDDGVAEE